MKKKYLLISLLIIVTFTQGVYGGLFDKPKSKSGDMWRKGYKAPTYIITNSDHLVFSYLLKGFEKDIPNASIAELNDLDNISKNLEKANVIFLIDKSANPDLLAKYQSQFNYAFTMPITENFNEGVISIAKHYKNKDLRYVYISAPNQEWLYKMIDIVKSYEKNEPPPINPIVIKKINLVDVFTNADKKIADGYCGDCMDLSKSILDISNEQNFASYDVSQHTIKQLAIFIDRSQTYNIPQFLKQYLPTDEVINNLKRNEVLIYKKTREKAPPIVFISAPNSEILKYQIENYNSEEKFAEQQRIIALRDVLIISNLPETITEEFLGKDYKELFKFEFLGSTGLPSLKVEQSEVVILLDRSSLKTIPQEVKNYIPKNALGLNFKKWQAIAIKEEVNNINKVFFSAPSELTLIDLIKNNKNISVIPGEVKIFDFPYSVVVSQLKSEDNPFLKPQIYKGFYDYYTPDNYQYNQEFINGDEIFLISRNISLPANVVKVLPEVLIKKPLKSNEALLFSLQKTNSSKKRYFIIAPTLNKLQFLLKEYSSLDKIPVEPTIISFADWRPIKKVLLIPKNYFNNFAGQKTISALINKVKELLLQKGFQVFLPTANLDLNAIENLLTSGNIPTAKELKGLGLVNYNAVAFIELSDVNGQTEYYLGNASRYPSPMNEFSLAPPQEPKKPDPNAQPLFSGHTYTLIDGSRENDPKYQKDLAYWENTLLPQYKKKYYEWEQKKDEYNEKKNNLQVTWSWPLYEKEWASCKININIYDLQNGKKLLTYSDSGDYKTSGKEIKTLTKKVIGDDTNPYEPEIPNPKEIVQQTTINEIASGTLMRFLSNLITSDSIAPDEGLTVNWPPVATTQQKTPAKQTNISTQKQNTNQKPITKQNINQIKKPIRN